MGTRYFLTVKCKCGFIDDDVYYAPTCGFTKWHCPECNRVTNLEKYTGISCKDASNRGAIKEIVRKICDKN
jgi:hypothetical protein